MNKDQREGLAEELTGYVNKCIGSMTGNEDRKVKGEVQITNGDNRKDLGDQKDNMEKGKWTRGIRRISRIGTRRQTSSLAVAAAKRTNGCASSHRFASSRSPAERRHG